MAATNKNGNGNINNNCNNVNNSNNGKNNNNGKIHNKYVFFDNSGSYNIKLPYFSLRKT